MKQHHDPMHSGISEIKVALPVRKVSAFGIMGATQWLPKTPFQLRLEIGGSGRSCCMCILFLKVENNKNV